MSHHNTYNIIINLKQYSWKDVYDQKIRLTDPSNENVLAV